MPSPSTSEKRDTMMLRIWLVISSSVKCASTPTISFKKMVTSSTRIAYVPNARSRTGPNSGSRSMIGFFVPHLRSVNCRVETKYTSALNGLLKPYFQPFSFERTGRFLVSSEYVPGSNTSAISPSLTNTAV